ncbi:reverse transcriptase domain-containing protein, partial [Pantoea dispersa]
MENQERTVQIRKGVRQGCSLSPLLFNAYVEEAMKEVKEKFPTGVKVQGERISMIRFADDIALLADSKEELDNMLNGMDRLLRTDFRLKINKR